MTFHLTENTESFNYNILREIKKAPLIQRCLEKYMMIYYLKFSIALLMASICGLMLEAF